MCEGWATWCPKNEDRFRARLLWFLLAAIVLAAGTQAFDRLPHGAQRGRRHLRLPHAADGAVAACRRPAQFGRQRPRRRPRRTSNSWCRCGRLDGIRIFESAARAALPQRAVLGFSNVQARGTTYRVFSIQTGAAVIQVAQDMAARRHMAGTLALRTVGPIALVAPLLMLVVWWVVSRSLAPVARVRRQVASRAGGRPLAGERDRPARRSAAAGA